MYPQQCVFTENMQIIKANISITERQDFCFNIQKFCHVWKVKWLCCVPAATTTGAETNKSQ